MISAISGRMSRSRRATPGLIGSYSGTGALPSARRTGPTRQRLATGGYTVATQLVDELVEATDEMFLTTTMGRYGRIVLLVIIEPGDVALDCRAAQP